MVVYPFRTNNSLNSGLWDTQYLRRCDTLTKPVRLKWLDMFFSKSLQTVENEDPATPPPPTPSICLELHFFLGCGTSDVCHVTWVIELFGYNRRFISQARRTRHLREPRNECEAFISLLPSFRASRKMPGSLCLAHKAPVTKGTIKVNVEPDSL